MRSGYSQRTVSTSSPTVNVAESSSISSRRRQAAGRLAGLDLAAGELPQPGEVGARPALRDEVAAGGVADEPGGRPRRRAAPRSAAAAAGRRGQLAQNPAHRAGLRSAAAAACTRWRRSP